MPLRRAALLLAEETFAQSNSNSADTSTAAGSTTNTTMRPRVPSNSDFDISLMPRDRIFQRRPYPWSVHHSLATGKWIATISRPDPHHHNNSSNKIRHIQMPFKTEAEARKFAKSYAPPQFHTGQATCMLCRKTPTIRHCRNCGVTVCDGCSTRWGARMVPKTYLASAALTVRVCKSCDWLGNAFCMALLQGRFDDAVELYRTGNINLRSCFADIRGEAMFPIHCAVMGGSLDIVRWLVDTHLCPISVLNDNKSQHASVQTSASRTLLDIAMTGRPKVDILVYLVQKGLNIRDVKDPNLVPKTLEAILKTGVPVEAVSADVHMILAEDESSLNDADHKTTIDDACNLCCDRPMDCVLTPCGHQVCCSECGSQLQTCPICKSSCNVLKVFRQ